MKAPLPIAVLACVTLCACAAKPVLFDKAGSTQLSFAQDRYACQQETVSAGNYTAAGAPLFVLAEQSAAQKRQQAMFVSCMEAHGYITEKR